MTEEQRPTLDRRAKGWAILGCVVIGICLILLLVGCGDDTPNPKSDLDEDNITLDTTGWTVYANYDEFPNVGAKCDGTTRLYTTTRLESALVVVPDHPLCQGGDS